MHLFEIANRLAHPLIDYYLLEKQLHWQKWDFQAKTQPWLTFISYGEKSKMQRDVMKMQQNGKSI